MEVLTKLQVDQQAQADNVRRLKTEKAPKQEIDEAVKKLLALKDQVTQKAKELGVELPPANAPASSSSSSSSSSSKKGAAAAPAAAPAQEPKKQETAKVTKQTEAKASAPAAAAVAPTSKKQKHEEEEEIDPRVSVFSFVCLFSTSTIDRSR
jgi:bifunctional glutamyl/prolyl-tRNA synthetase